MPATATDVDLLFDIDLRVTFTVTLPERRFVDIDADRVPMCDDDCAG
ncbi:MAG TPA: hypothetical protein VH333_23525 [Pseudonocardiaceae bacterium]|jgi:hypothetical protein|nr:hypothetical protein [Pseudonocardiaceae bacterium]